MLQLGVCWPNDPTGIGKVRKLKHSIALLLLAAVVIIVVAPSVDLEPTILRSAHHLDRVLMLVAAASFGSAHGANLHTLPLSRFCLFILSIFSPNDLVALVCTRRC